MPWSASSAITASQYGSNTPSQHSTRRGEAGRTRRGRSRTAAATGSVGSGAVVAWCEAGRFSSEATHRHPGRGHDDGPVDAGDHCRTSGEHQCQRHEGAHRPQPAELIGHGAGRPTSASGWPSPAPRPAARPPPPPRSAPCGRRAAGRPDPAAASSPTTTARPRSDTSREGRGLPKAPKAKSSAYDGRSHHGGHGHDLGHRPDGRRPVERLLLLAEALPQPADVALALAEDCSATGWANTRCRRRRRRRRGRAGGGPARGRSRRGPGPRPRSPRRPTAAAEQAPGQHRGHQDRVAQVRLQDEAAHDDRQRQAHQVAVGDRPRQHRKQQERQQHRGGVPRLDEHGAAHRPAQEGGDRQRQGAGHRRRPGGGRPGRARRPTAVDQRHADRRPRGVAEQRHRAPPARRRGSGPGWFMSNPTAHDVEAHMPSRRDLAAEDVLLERMAISALSPTGTQSLVATRTAATRIGRRTTARSAQGNRRGNRVGTRRVWRLGGFGGGGGRDGHVSLGGRAQGRELSNTLIRGPAAARRSRRSRSASVTPSGLTRRSRRRSSIQPRSSALSGS